MIPEYIQPFLWSYDIAKMDIQRNRKIIILNILNLGDVKAVKWLFKMYKKEEIKEVIESSSLGEWNKKSLNFWKLFFVIQDNKIKERQEKSLIT
jgi:hypothetical protein